MRVDVLGIGFDDLTMEEAVERGMELLHSPGAHYVVTPNPEIVEVCREDLAARQAVNAADLVLADGIGVVKGAQMMGTPLKGRVPGIEFAAGLMERMASEGLSLYLLGAKPGVAEAAGVVEAIRDSGADCVFVCLGAPKQERWMAKHGAQTGAHLLCGLGGSLDVFAGVVERAPKFWCDHDLEWFYRLCRDPRRLGRMMKLPLFLVHVRKEKRRR